MNATKRKILDTSLRLFNDQGLTNVSQRKITDTLKISPGNLTYHFKKKDDISEALYFEFIENIEFEIRRFLKLEINLQHFALLTERWFYHMYQYRFIFHDITNLMRMNQKIAVNYQNLVKVRESLFLKSVNKFIDQKTMRKEERPNEYQYLYNRLHIVSDFYLSSVKVLKPTTKKDQLRHQQIFFHAIYPYLTKKGRKELSL